MSIFIDGMRVSEEDEVKPGPAAEPTEDDLRFVASRVSMELQRAELLSRTAVAGESLPAEVRTALREACVLRVRRLRAFFYESSEEHDRPVAADFFRDPTEWESERPSLGPMLGFWLDEVGDPSAVLDHRQRELPPEKWPLLGFVAAISRVFDSFVRNLPPERAGWFAARSVHSVA